MIFLWACTPSKIQETAVEDSFDSAIDTAEEIVPHYLPLRVWVTLDEEAIEGAWVYQPGTEQRWQTDAQGKADITINTRVEGTMAIAVSHPQARIRGEEFYWIDSLPQEYTVALQRYSPLDHEEYVFQDPGTPERNQSTNQCSHCHVTINEDWVSSMHAQSASNPKVQHIFSGTSGINTQEECIIQGGDWVSWPLGGVLQDQCFLGDSVWNLLNPDCSSPSNCTDVQGGFCADCHAPGIDGSLGGRSLLEATGLAYDHGVHCDVCHKVESVDRTSVLPGVAGALRILRPEPPPFPASIANAIMFGPHGDVMNPRMGSVQRDHFRTADLCFGCHQFSQPVLAGAEYNEERWPSGLLPIHSTYEELKAGPLADISCQSCHMPPDSEVGNGADLGNVIELHPDLAVGWYRPAGQVRKHGWYGPRSDKPMLELAASVHVSTQLQEDELHVSVVLKNVGPGHAIPTGEPSRILILLVDAFCGQDELALLHGPVVPDFGGYTERKLWGEDWLDWPQGQVGDKLRIVIQEEGFYDYNGFGSFALGNWSAEEKGLVKERLVAERTIIGFDSSSVLLDGELPEGDIIYRSSPTEIFDNMPSVGWAGHPGFAFARVLSDTAGRKMVPHFLAVDVLSDNRLLPQESWQTEHIFTASCTEPKVVATLLYRDQPLWLSTEKGWEATDRIMVTQ